MRDFKEYIDQFNRDGCAVIPDFLTNDEMNSIQNEIEKIIENLDYTAHRNIFATGNNQPSILDKYFQDSVDKIR